MNRQPFEQNHFNQDRFALRPPASRVPPQGSYAPQLAGPASAPPPPDQPARRQSSVPPAPGQPPYHRLPVPPQKNGRFPRIAIVFIIAGIALLAYLGISGIQKLKENRVAQEIAPYEGVYGDNISINDVSISGMTPKQALDTLMQTMDRRVHEWSLELTYNGWKFYTLDYPALGISFSEQQLYPFLNEAWALTHTGDVFARQKAINERKNNPYQAYTTKKEFNEANLTNILNQIAQAINTEPVEAALVQFRPDESDPFLIRDEQIGRKLNIEETKKQILEMAAAGTGGSYELKPEITNPTVTRADIERTVALRAEATTAISKSSPESRNNNIRVALSRINGLTLDPGKTFSFNKVVGPRTLKDGFYEALEQVSGDLVTGVGGGVCQVSTTVYQAALLNDLKIVKRSIHGAPVGYTEKGQDATVFLSRDREIDFQFKNTSGGKLYFTAHVEQGATKKTLLTKVRIYGPSLGDNVTYRLNSVIDQVLTSFDISYEPDKEQKYVTYKDETKLLRKSIDGYQVSTYLRKYVDGVMVDERLISTDKYLPTPAKYWRGIQNR